MKKKCCEVCDAFDCIFEKNCCRCSTPEDCNEECKCYKQCGLCYTRLHPENREKLKKDEV